MLDMYSILRRKPKHSTNRKIRLKHNLEYLHYEIQQSYPNLIYNGKTFISSFAKEKFKKERKQNILKKKLGFVQVNDLKNKNKMLRNPFFKSHTARFEYSKCQETRNIEIAKMIQNMNVPTKVKFRKKSKRYK